MESDPIDSILNKVKQGEISAEEGARRLRELESREPEGGYQSSAADDGPAYFEASPEVIDETGFTPEQKARWQNWWIYPFWVSLGLFVFAAGLMAWSFSNGLFFWFYCAWLPMLLGVLGMALAAWSRQSRWLHVRVKETKESRSSNISISMPIPTQFAGWALRTFGPMIPQLRERNVVETIAPMLETLGNSKEPLIVEVNEKDGEKVQVYIV